MLKCPNPSCPYVFDPSQVPVGVVLSCPRCAMQFTLGPPQAAAPPPTGYPAAPTGFPAPPPASEFEGVGLEGDEDRDPDERRPARGTNKFQVFILVGIAAVLMAGTGLAIFFKLTHRGGSDATHTVAQLRDLNISVAQLPSGWTQDDTMRVKVGAPFVMSYQRKNPEAYMAFGATEAPKGRSPRPSDMTNELLQPFPKLFVTTADDNTLRKDPPVASSWLGEPIAPATIEPFPNGFKFRAQSSDGLSWAGEAYTVAHKGIAYYWLSWCLESDYDVLKDEFATFRGKFKLLDTRKDWKETQSNVMDFKGDKVSYVISDTDEVWKEIESWRLLLLQKQEPELDKSLEIKKTRKGDRKAIPDRAELNVYILESGGDPKEVARKFVEDKETKRIASGGLTVAFEELTDAEQGDPLPQSVPANAPAVRLKTTVEGSASSNRLLVVSAIKVGDKIVAVECGCELAKRSVFEARFVQIAKSLR